jgi:hypothetical protein
MLHTEICSVMYFLYSASVQLTVTLNISTDNQHFHSRLIRIGERSKIISNRRALHQFQKERNLGSQESTSIITS